MTIAEYLQSLPDNAFEQKQAITAALLRVYQDTAIRYTQDNAKELETIMLGDDAMSPQAVDAIDIQLMEPEEVKNIVWETVAPGLDDIDFTAPASNVWEGFQRKVLDTLIATAAEDTDNPISEPQQLLAAYFTAQVADGHLLPADEDTEDSADMVHEIFAGYGDEDADYDTDETSLEAVQAQIEHLLSDIFPQWEQEILQLMQVRRLAEQQEVTSQAPSREIQWD